MNIGRIIATVLLMMMLSQLCLGEDTKTAYTKDGAHFISKARMEENIKHEYAKRGDYREVQVPLSTPVAGATEFVEDTSGRVQSSSRSVNEQQTGRSQSSSKEMESSNSNEGWMILLLLILITVSILFVPHVKNKINPLDKRSTDIDNAQLKSSETQTDGSKTIVPDLSSPQTEQSSLISTPISVGNASNNMRNIGILAFIFGLIGYFIPVYNGRSVIEVSNLCNSALGLLAQGLGGSNVESACSEANFLAKLVYVLLLVGVLLILYSALKK